MRHVISLDVLFKFINKLFLSKIIKITLITNTN